MTFMEPLTKAVKIREKGKKNQAPEAASRGHEGGLKTLGRIRHFTYGESIMQPYKYLRAV